MSANTEKHAGVPWALFGWSVALGAALLLPAVNGAVGFFGGEKNPANAILLAILAVAGIGSLLALGRPEGMVKAMAATAAAQLLVGVVAVIGGLGAGGWKGLYEAVLGTTMFASLWLLSAWLFRNAARRDAHSAR